LFEKMAEIDEKLAALTVAETELEQPAGALLLGRFPAFA
jgi:hypothetical protein